MTNFVTAVILAAVIAVIGINMLSAADAALSVHQDRTAAAIDAATR